MNEEELRKHLSRIIAGPGTIQEKLTLFQALESERRVDMLLHKLNTIEANLIAEIRAIRFLQNSPKPGKKKSFFWRRFRRKKKS